MSWIKLNTPHVWPNSSNICVEFYCTLFIKLVRLQAELAFRGVMHQHKIHCMKYRLQTKTNKNVFVGFELASLKCAVLPWAWVIF